MADKSAKKTKEPEEINKEALDQLKEKTSAVQEFDKKSTPTTERLQKFFSKTPYKVKDEAILLRYVLLFHEMLSKIKVEDLTKECFNSLGDDDLVAFHQYINKSFELLSVGTKDFKINTN